MTERYFPGFAFTPYQPTEITTIPLEEKTQNTLPSIGKVYVGDAFDGLSIRELKLSTYEWNPTQIQKEFEEQLQSISVQIGGPPLTISNIDIQFVTKEEMLHKTDAERQSLIDWYGGDYIADGVTSDCQRNNDGTFTLRIVDTSKEKSMAKDDVLQSMAHEYGHTLGPEFLESPVFEELKAYTFARLFMRHSYDDGLDTLQIVHKTASLKLGQLLDSGLKEEAIIAHLIGQPFGGFQPDDYIKVLDANKYS